MKKLNKLVRSGLLAIGVILVLIIAHLSLITTIQAEGWCTSATCNQIRPGECVPDMPGYRYQELCEANCSTIGRAPKQDQTCGQLPAGCPNPNDIRCTLGTINDPTGVPGNNGDEKISNFLSTIIRLIFTVGAVIFVFMILAGAFQWITSAGDKEALTKARQRITQAIIGLVLLSLAFVIINVLGNITNIGILGKDQSNPNQPSKFNNTVPDTNDQTVNFNTDRNETPNQPAFNNSGTQPKNKPVNFNNPGTQTTNQEPHTFTNDPPPTQDNNNFFSFFGHLMGGGN